MTTQRNRVDMSVIEQIGDPLGAATRVILRLPLPKDSPYYSSEEIEAIMRAGLAHAVAVFVDRPTCDETLWPEADRVFLDSLRSWERAGYLDPIVWCRVATAPNRIVVDDSLMRGGKGTRIAPPTDPAWPVDFCGLDRQYLGEHVESEADEVVQHIPPGDGWHRVAWVRTTTNEGSWRIQLLCECDLQGVVRPGGGRTTFGDDRCVYRPIAAYMRALTIRPWVGSAAATAAFRPLLARAHAGEWIGQDHGSQFWGSNLYVQTVAAILGIPMRDIWPIVEKAAADRFIGLEGAVVILPNDRPQPHNPRVPLVPWGEDEDIDERVVWWARLRERFQIEVVRQTDGDATLAVYDHEAADKVIGVHAVTFAFDAAFGPDAADVDVWQRIADGIITGSE